MPMRSWHPLIPNHLDIESLKQLRMHHDAIERATRRWRPKLKPVAFACWFQLVEVCFPTALLSCGTSVLTFRAFLAV
jgi:hypothetical protein